MRAVYALGFDILISDAGTSHAAWHCACNQLLLRCMPQNTPCPHPIAACRATCCSSGRHHAPVSPCMRVHGTDTHRCLSLHGPHCVRHCAVQHASRMRTRGAPQGDARMRMHAAEACPRIQPCMHAMLAAYGRPTACMHARSFHMPVCQPKRCLLARCCSSSLSLVPLTGVGCAVPHMPLPLIRLQTWCG